MIRCTQRSQGAPCQSSWDTESFLEPLSEKRRFWEENSSFGAFYNFRDSFGFGTFYYFREFLESFYNSCRPIFIFKVLRINFEDKSRGDDQRHEFIEQAENILINCQLLRTILLHIVQILPNWPDTFKSNRIKTRQH